MKPSGMRSNDSEQAGDHLVEDEQRAVLRAPLAQVREEPRIGWDEAHVGGDRLDQHRGEVAAVLRERRIDRGDVVVGRDDGIGDGALGDARGAGQAERRDAAPAATSSASRCPW
jgi:hypothetical protein